MLFLLSSLCLSLSVKKLYGTHLNPLEILRAGGKVEYNQIPANFDRTLTCHLPSVEVKIIIPTVDSQAVDSQDQERHADVTLLVLSPDTISRDISHLTKKLTRRPIVCVLNKI